uniref:Uncharacterized protein n=1 Tax=Romanomermis culicivorax TaxID=13658 RepID=A0A915J613_ROMCU
MVNIRIVPSKENHWSQVGLDGPLFVGVTVTSLVIATFSGLVESPLGGACKTLHDEKLIREYC